jgi:hypothetical protein
MSAQAIETPATPDVTVTTWESMDQTDAGLDALGAKVGTLDHIADNGSALYGERARQTYAAVLHGPRGTVAKLARGALRSQGVDLSKVGSTDKEMKAARAVIDRAARVGKVLIARPEMHPFDVRAAVHSATEETVLSIIESGNLTPGSGNGGGGGGDRDKKSLREQWEDRSKNLLTTLRKAGEAGDAEVLALADAFISELRSKYADAMREAGNITE